MPSKQRRFRSSAERALWTEEIEAGAFDLREHEEWWRDRYEFLQSKGYILRPRYKPGWIPSWQGTDLIPVLCEDSMSTSVNHVVCAI